MPRLYLTKPSLKTTQKFLVRVKYFSLNHQEKIGRTKSAVSSCLLLTLMGRTHQTRSLYLHHFPLLILLTGFNVGSGKNAFEANHAAQFASPDTNSQLLASLHWLCLWASLAQLVEFASFASPCAYFCICIDFVYDLLSLESLNSHLVCTACNTAYTPSTKHHIPRSRLLARFNFVSWEFFACVEYFQLAQLRCPIYIIRIAPHKFASIRVFALALDVIYSHKSLNSCLVCTPPCIRDWLTFAKKTENELNRHWEVNVVFWPIKEVMLRTHQML